MFFKSLRLSTLLIALTLIGCATTSPLTSAVSTDNIIAVQKALKSGSNINEVDSNGHTALTLAVSNGNKKIVKYLLEHNANPNARGQKEEDYPILLATKMTAKSRRAFANKKGNIEIIKLLLDAGADVNQKSLLETPLINSVRTASLIRNTDVIMLLLDRGAVVNTKTLLKKTAISQAASYKNTQVLNILMNASSSSEIISSFPDIVKSGNIDLIQKLIADGADVHGNHTSGYPIINASSGKNPEVIKLLVATGANINQLDLYGRGVLHHARELDVIEVLIALGANINSTKNPPLSWHVSGKNIKVIKYLLSAGANPNQKPLIYNLLKPSLNCGSRGVTESEMTIFKYLMTAGADINKKGKHGRTALHMVAECADTETTKLLLDSGASVTVTDNDGKTAYRVCRGNCKYLAARSGIRNEKSNFGKIFATMAIAGLAGQADLSASDSARVMSATVNDIWIKDGKGSQLANLNKSYVAGEGPVNSGNPIVDDLVNTKRKQQSAFKIHKKSMKEYQAIIKKQKQKYLQKPTLYQQQLNRIAKFNGRSENTNSTSNTTVIRPSQSSSSTSYKRKSAPSNSAGITTSTNSSRRVAPSSSCTSPAYTTPSFTAQGKNVEPYNSVGAKVNTYMNKTCGSDKPSYNSNPKIECEILEKIKSKYFSNLTVERCTSEPFTFTCSCDQKAGSGRSM